MKSQRNPSEIPVKSQVRVTLNDLNASEEVLRISAWGISRLEDLWRFGG